MVYKDSVGSERRSSSRMTAVTAVRVLAALLVLTASATAADAVDRALAPRSFPVPGVRVRLEVTLVRERGTAANVVGILPGTDPRLAREAIVIGAHYDHLGRGGEGSLAPDQVGAIHAGADDNASGTAAVLGLARALAAAGGTPRTLVFVAFAGEEMGLLGSTHYVRQPAHPLEATALMVNLDMIGRLRDGKPYVAGVDSGTGLRALVTAVPGPGLTPQLRSDPFSPSDHITFYATGRPVLFFFTGAHTDYHRPSDTWEKISASGLHAVTIAVRHPFEPRTVHVDEVEREGASRGAPMFSRDGSKLVFCSSRNAAAPRDLNVFVADWVS